MADMMDALYEWNAERARLQTKIRELEAAKEVDDEEITALHERIAELEKKVGIDCDDCCALSDEQLQELLDNSKARKKRIAALETENTILWRRAEHEAICRVGPGRPCDCVLSTLTRGEGGA